MSVERVTLRSLLARAARHWRPKLASLVAAVLVWLFATSSSVTTTQRNLTVPLVVEGVGEDQVAVGLPAMIEVAVSGPGPRVDRLRPDMLLATLDLTDAAGAFEREITVQPPPQIRVLEVVPADVIGFLESVTTRQLPITVTLNVPLPEDRQLTTQATPSVATITGRGQVLDQISSVLAVTTAVGGQAPLVALDAAGAPVAEVTIFPAAVTVAVQTREAFVARTVPIVLAPVAAANLSSTTLSSETVELLGPSAVLAALESVAASVEAPTGVVSPGRYTLPVRLELPTGVAALGNPTATLVYVDSPIQP